MEEQNILDIRTRNEFRQWLATHHATEKACWVCVKRGRPTDDGTFWYLDAVEEALCFGWIDSRQKPINGVLMQCFTPRKRNSPWSELNKERARRLEKLGRMTDVGRRVLPQMGVRSFRIDEDVEAALKTARAWLQRGLLQEEGRSDVPASPRPPRRRDEKGKDVRRMERLRPAVGLLVSHLQTNKNDNKTSSRYEILHR